MAEEICVVCSERPVGIKKVSKCLRCYHRDYFQERYVPRPRKPRELRGVKLGSTPETSTPCTYYAAHHRVRSVRGLPTKHACVVCGDPASEWAYRGDSPYEIVSEYNARKRGKQYVHQGRWSPYVWDYDPLCVKCHQLRDSKSFTFELLEGITLKIDRAAPLTPELLKFLEGVIEDRHALLILQDRVVVDTA